MKPGNDEDESFYFLGGVLCEPPQPLLLVLLYRGFWQLLSISGVPTDVVCPSLAYRLTPLRLLSVSGVLFDGACPSVEYLLTTLVNN